MVPQGAKGSGIGYDLNAKGSGIGNAKGSGIGYVKGSGIGNQECFKFVLVLF